MKRDGFDSLENLSQIEVAALMWPFNLHLLIGKFLVSSIVLILSYANGSHFLATYLYASVSQPFFLFAANYAAKVFLEAHLNLWAFEIYLYVDYI